MVYCHRVLQSILQLTQKSCRLNIYYMYVVTAHRGVHSRNSQVLFNCVKSKEHLSALTCRNLLATRMLSKDVNLDDEFTVIYKLPFIRALRSFSRVKILQTAITVASIPPLLYCYNSDIISLYATMYSLSLAGFATLMLYSTSFYSRRIIGVMAINTDLTMLRVSHLTFWGHRVDFTIPVVNVVPSLEVGDRPHETLRKFKKYGSDELMYYTLRFGYILDKEKFEYVFGALT
uniref:Transmembrane protein 186 n=1 Tax=Saccoglossus kowalevskii TaxID=10224 RepID=A0ABM0GPP3_SACKO|nr:PREDICTED: transmembrane protein 186-like [Saccoglossus kowalevskii]